jgi:two-component system sensor histidine kinase RegB
MSRSHQAQRPAFLLATASSLKRLVALRRIEIITQAMVLVLAVAWLKIPLEVVPMTAVIALLAAVNLWTQWRIDTGGPCPREKSSPIWQSTSAFSLLLLYFAGGSANPFVSLFLLPPTLAAAMLPARHAWAMATLTLLAYTFLIFWKLPLPPPQGDLAQFDANCSRAPPASPTNTPRTAAALPSTCLACGSTS